MLTSSEVDEYIVGKQKVTRKNLSRINLNKSQKEMLLRLTDK